MPDVPRAGCPCYGDALGAAEGEGARLAIGAAPEAFAVAAGETFAAAELAAALGAGEVVTAAGDAAAVGAGVGIPISSLCKALWLEPI